MTLPEFHLLPNLLYDPEARLDSVSRGQRLAQFRRFLQLLVKLPPALGLACISSSCNLKRAFRASASSVMEARASQFQRAGRCDSDKIICATPNLVNLAPLKECRVPCKVVMARRIALLLSITYSRSDWNLPHVWLVPGIFNNTAFSVALARRMRTSLWTKRSIPIAKIT